MTISYREPSLDLLEYLILGDCELQQVVAARNSSLGRLAQPSQRLVHELDFLRLGDACVENLLLSDPALAEKLRGVIEVKRGELPGRIADALILGDEFRQFWAASGGEPQISAESLEALAAFEHDVRRWLSGDYEVDGAAMELRLQQLSLDHGGAILLAWVSLGDELNAASGAVNRRAASRPPLCGENIAKSRGKIFGSVVTRYFLTRLQKEIAVLNKSTYDLVQHIDNLESALAVAQPVAYRSWREERDSVISRGRQAVTAHVESLAPLLKQCGFLPG